jgi:hypothetical protein
LEEKVNRLLPLLDHQQETVTNSRGSVSTITLVSRIQDENVDTPLRTHIHSLESSPAQLVTEKSRHFDAIESKLLSIEIADSLLNTYKEIHSKLSPFVLVAPDVDATALRNDSPFLFLAIVMTCLESDHMLQRALGMELKRILCERVLMGNERDMDLLQGLLVYLSWNHYHFNPMSNSGCMLLQMAIGLMTDLHLDRCPAHRDQTVGSDLCRKNSHDEDFPAQCQRPLTELRAILGCFYLSSS